MSRYKDDNEIILNAARNSLARGLLRLSGGNEEGGPTKRRRLNSHELDSSVVGNGRTIDDSVIDLEGNPRPVT